MDVLADGLLDGRDLRGGPFRLGPRPHNLQLRSESVGVPLPRDGQRLVLAVERGVRDFELALRASKLQVGPSRLRGDHEDHAAPPRGRPFFFGGRGLDQATGASPQVHRPLGVKAHLKEVALQIGVGEIEHGVAPTEPEDRCPHADPWKEERPCDFPRRAGLTNASLCNLEVVVRGNGPFNKRSELGIVEPPPPGRFRGRGRVEPGPGGVGEFRVAPRHLRGRRCVVRPHHAAGQRQARRGLAVRGRSSNHAGGHP